MTNPAPLESLAEDQLLRHVLSASSDMVFVKDSRNRLLWANRSFCEFYGKPLLELRDFVEPDETNAARYLAEDARVLQQGETVEIPEEPALRCDGLTRWFHTVKTPLFDGKGVPTMLVAVSRDVTDLRANRISLTRINECLLGFGPDSFGNIARLTALCGELLDADSAVYKRVDKGYLTVVGGWNLPAGLKPTAPMEGTHCGDAVKRTGDKLFIAKESAQIYIGRSVRCGYRVVGVLSVLLRRDVAEHSVFTKVMGILASAIAVEEERLRTAKERALLTEELRQANKVEAIGRLAGGIAHDFNNTLTVIKGYAEFLKLNVPAAAADAAEIVKSANFAASLTRQLLAFERRQITAPRIVSLNAILADFTRILKRLIGAHIDLVVADTRAQARVYSDPGQMEQILVNLALNARDAMPEGGRLSLAIAEIDSKALPEKDGPTPSGRYVELTVTDTGCGISPEVLPRIFEPFFTTKDSGKGTGLGLSTVADIVKLNGGRITCDSAPGRGTTFRVYLPLCLASLTVEPASALLPVERGHGHILLVEDDADLRTMFARILRATGYEVTEAAHAEEAVALAAGLGDRLAALVTDMVLPGMNGQQLASALERARPGLRVLYLSGYSDDVAFRGPIKTDVSFLQKPFSPQELCLKLQAVLSS